MKLRLLASLTTIALATSLAFAQPPPDNAPELKKDVPYVPSPDGVVRKMLEMAHVGASDVLYDLGSGDGRIVIAAARRGARGVGVDIDPERIAESDRNAREARAQNPA